MTLTHFSFPGHSIHCLFRSTTPILKEDTLNRLLISEIFLHKQPLERLAITRDSVTCLL